MEQRITYLLSLRERVRAQIVYMQNLICRIHAWRSVAEHPPRILNYDEEYWLPFLHTATDLEGLLLELELQVLVQVLPLQWSFDH